MKSTRYDDIVGRIFHVKIDISSIVEISCFDINYSLLIFVSPNLTDCFFLFVFSYNI